MGDSGQNSAAKSVGAERTVLDMEHLEHHTFGDHSLRDELLDMFAGQLGQYLGALETSANHDDWLAAAHTLKGSAKAIGAIEISAICEVLEDVKPEGWRQQRKEPLSRLQTAADECRTFIAEMED